MECTNPVYLSKQEMYVGCNHCVPCMAKSRRDWAVRLHFEHKFSSNAYFLTLTYAEEALPRDDCGFPTLRKADISEFLTKIRSASRVRVSGKQVNLSPRWFVVGEYGPKTERPHYHALVFNILPEVLAKLVSYWGKGFITVKKVTAKRIQYVAKYQITKSLVNNTHGSFDRELPFKVVTKSSGGLGKQWLTDENKAYAKRDLTGTLRTPSGVSSIPKYYRDRIGYTPSERTLCRESQISHIEKQYLLAYQSLRDLGFIDPASELKYRESVAISKILRKIVKGLVI